MRKTNILLSTALLLSITLVHVHAIDTLPSDHDETVSVVNNEIILDTQYFEPSEEEILEQIERYICETEGIENVHIISFEPVTSISINSSSTPVYTSYKTRTFFPPGQAELGSSFPTGGYISYAPSEDTSESFSISYGGVSYSYTLPTGYAYTGNVTSYSYYVAPTTSYVKLKMTRVDKIILYSVYYEDQYESNTYIVPVTSLYSLTPVLEYN